MDRSLRLAALASAAVPGLDPMAVQEVVGGADEHFDVAFVQDTQQRRWVVRAPRTEVAAAHMDASLALLALLVRRVPFAVPAAKGFAPIPKIGRAAVHAYIPGHPLDLSALQPGHPVTAELGRTIAVIHNVDRALYDEAGLASYDAESYRRRHLAEIDRGAATGRVPAGLLARWEEALDDVRLWRFAPTPVHGALSGSDVLVGFPDRADASRAAIRGVTGWEDAKVADPADDFAALVAEARPEVVDAVVRAYAHVRVERPDEHLLSRARLVSELALLATLLRAVSARDEVATEATTARLRRLDDIVHSEAGSRRLTIVPAPALSTRASTPATGPVPGTASAPSREGVPAPDEAVPGAAQAEGSAGAKGSEGSERAKGSEGSERAEGAEGAEGAEPDGDATDVIEVVPAAETQQRDEVSDGSREGAGSTDSQRVTADDAESEKSEASDEPQNEAMASPAVHESTGGDDEATGGESPASGGGSARGDDSAATGDLAPEGASDALSGSGPGTVVTPAPPTPER